MAANVTSQGCRTQPDLKGLILKCWQTDIQTDIVNL